MLGRFFNLISAMFNRGMSKLETPEVLAEQAQAELDENLKQMTNAVAASLTQEKNLEKQLQKNTEEIGTWEKRATVAVQGNNDELAKQCLQKKQAAVQLDRELKTQLETQRNTTASLKASYADLQKKRNEFTSKSSGLTARAHASDAVAKANELIAGTSGGGADKWEQKIMQKEMRNEAVSGMSSPIADEHKFLELDKASELDDDLARLKAQMAGGQEGPKLITVREIETKTGDEE